MRIARCDECTKEAPIGRFSDAPDVWFYAEQSFETSDHEDRTWHFCSQSCLGTFFTFRELLEPERRSD